MTLLSEYQIREYGYVIDSIATKYLKSATEQGTQCFTLSNDVHIPFKDRGGIMGFEILEITKDDFDSNGEPLHDVFEITGSQQWVPAWFRDTTAHTIQTATPNAHDDDDIACPVTTDGLSTTVTVNTIVRPTPYGRLSETIKCGANRDDEDVCEDQEVVCRAEAPLCNIPKRNFSRSIVRPYHGNNRVKWDPSFASVPFQKPAPNGGDTMSDKERRNRLLNDSMDQYDDLEP